MLSSFHFVAFFSFRIDASVVHASLFGWLHVKITHYKITNNNTNIIEINKQQKKQLNKSKKYEQTQTSNKPRIRTNSKVFDWAQLAALAPQKHRTESKKIRTNPNFEQTQNSNKFKNRIENKRSVLFFCTVKFCCVLFWRCFIFCDILPVILQTCVILTWYHSVTEIVSMILVF